MKSFFSFENGFEPINDILGRYGVKNNISKREIKKLSRIKNLKVIQFVEPVKNNSVWKNIEQDILRKRPEIEVRVYGHYHTVCNLNFLEFIPSAKSFSVDCLLECKNLEKIALLENLEELSIGVYNIESFDFLNHISEKLTSLFIGRTKSKKPNISVIERFKNLEYLYLEGQNKGIQTISKLKNLEKIVLRSITTNNLDYLKNLEKLWSVDIKLGGIKDFNSLKDIKNLKFLEIWQVRKLLNLDFLSKLNNLQNLFIQSLPNIKEFPDLSNNTELRRIFLENLKGLDNLKSIENIKNLEDFVFWDCKLNPKDFYPVLKNKSLKNVQAKFGSTRKNDEFDNLVSEFRKNQYKSNKFKYQ